jgi:predicted dehydrogenase
VSAPLLVVGCGSIGRRHLRNLSVLTEDALLAYDPEPVRRELAARESSAESVESLDAGLASGPRAVLICSPTAFHGEQAMQAAACADLFIEKPVAASRSEAEAVRAAVARHGRRCLVACNLRFHPGVVALKKALDEGAVGRPLSLRVEFGQYLPDWHPWEDYRNGYSARADLGGGVVRDEVHELDLVRWLAGELADVRALKGRVGDLEIDTEDIGLLIGRTERGAWCEIHVDYLQRVPGRCCRVIGTEGTLLWDVPSGLTTLQRPGRQTETLADFRGWDTNEMYALEMVHLLACLDGRAEPLQDLDQAIRLMAVVERFEPLGAA